jgi:hypothetical protein
LQGGAILGWDPGLTFCGDSDSMALLAHLSLRGLRGFPFLLWKRNSFGSVSE